MKSVDLIDKFWNVYRVNNWIHKCKWWWSILFCGHVLVLVKSYIILKTLCEEVNTKPMTHYEFWCLVLLENIDLMHFGGCDHLVSAVQCRCIRGENGSTTTTNVSVLKVKEKKQQ